MTTTADPGAATTAVDSVEATIGGGITRLNAADGLFLRAEHLTAMQDYARELARCVGQAAGTGVVYGYGAGLVDDVLHIGSGLAIDTTGRPLRALSDATLRLTDLVDAPDRFWVVEVAAAEPGPFGSQSVFGNLCDDPCSPATIQPWSAEDVVVRVRPDTMPHLDDPATVPRARNWLASAYFERERGRGGPWLTPADGGPVQPIATRPWSAPAPTPTGAAVPVALLFHVDGGWVLDVWAARRELDATAAQAGWQWRLGLRPWRVFLAEVLQFSDQLAGLWPAAGPAAAPALSAEILAAQRALVDHDNQGRRSGRLSNELAAALKAVLPVVPAAATTVLPNLGIGELPPAGFLPAMPADVRTAPAEYYGRLFGGSVDVRVCTCRADYVPQALLHAQHLDRIPLDGTGSAIDVLVPDGAVELGPLRPAATTYGWVAFVRRSEPSCGGPATEDVDVFLYAGKEAVNVVLDGYEKLSPKVKVPLGTLSYPARSWTYPDGTVMVVDALAKADRPAMPGGSIALIAAVAADAADDRAPLAALRATLFAASIDHGTGAPRVYGASVAGLDRESILVVLPDTK